jgi:hypothetical protein
MWLLPIHAIANSLVVPSSLPQKQGGLNIFKKINTNFKWYVQITKNDIRVI